MPSMINSHIKSFILETDKRNVKLLKLIYYPLPLWKYSQERGGNIISFDDGTSSWSIFRMKLFILLFILKLFIWLNIFKTCRLLLLVLLFEIYMMWSYALQAKELIYYEKKFLLQKKILWFVKTKEKKGYSIKKK